MSWPEAALIGIPGGIGVALTGVAWIGVSLAFVLTIVAGVGLWQSGRFAGVTAYQDEFRDSDYSPIQRWLPLAGTLAAMFIAVDAPFEPLLEMGLSAETQQVISTIVAVGALTVGLKFESSRSHRMGRRRLELLQGKQKELNDDHLVPSPKHMEVISALVAVGAVDGMRTDSRGLNRLVGYDVTFEIEELEKAGYLDRRRQYGSKGEITYEVTLTRIP